MREQRDKGYTLVELLVVILIFGVVMTLISTSFTRIVASYGQTVKSVETDIGGLIGLELFRTDLGLAGFGLPWSVPRDSYPSGEVQRENHQANGIADTDAFNFNDPSTTGPPRAFALLNNKGVNGSDYLVLKGSALGWSSTSRSWSYLNYSSLAPILKPPKSEVELVPGAGDRVIVINSRLRNGLAAKELVTSDSSFYTTFPKLGKEVPNGFRPRSAQDRYLVYGIASKSDPGDTVTFPFNRADYYLDYPNKESSGPSRSSSSICAPGTAVLYRGAVSQSGNFWQMPILDCVADMQVMFRIDNPQQPDETQPLDDLDTLGKLYGEAGDEAAAQRRHVREVRVYILAQQGKMDPGYTYPGNCIVVGPRPPSDKPACESEVSSWVSIWDSASLSKAFGSEWMHYHWKVYTIAVQPKNLD